MLTQIDIGLFDPDAHYNGFKNRIINGAMMIDQRNAGASYTVATGAVYYTVDRWAAYCTGANITTQRVAGPTPYQYAVQITGATSNTLIQYLQRIESYNCYDLAGQSITFSCTLKASTATTVNVYFANANSTDNYAGATTFASTSFNVTTSAQTFTFTTTAAANVVNGMYVMFAFNSGLGAGVTFQITSCQLEKGTTATSFDYRPYGTELALCQRYFYNATPSNPYGFLTMGATLSTTSGSWQIPLPVPMRTTPTFAYSGTIVIKNLSGAVISSFAGPYGTGSPCNSAEGDFTCATTTSGAAAFINFNNAGKLATFSAEL